LADRFGQDLTDDVRFRPGQAPAGWTGLVSQLRSRGVTGEEMTAAGVATVASTGRLIDRFHDRVIFPIINNGEVLGFVGRRHPDLTDTDRGGPKYLNTADTPLFHKGAQLFGASEVDVAARWRTGDRGRTDGRHRRNFGRRRPLHRCRATGYVPHR
jgi:DNA primase